MLRQLGIAALVLGAVVGCGSAAERPRAAGEQPAGIDVMCPSQDLFGASGKRSGLPADYVAAAVVRCRTEVRHAPGEGVWVVRITERADLPVPRLVEMLRRPSDEPHSGACPTVGYTVPYFLLLDEEGKALAPKVPTEPCGAPRREVVDTLDFLPYRIVAETRVAHTNSTSDGCYDRRKDLIATEPPKPAPATPVWPDASDSFSVCGYKVSGEAGHLETEFSLSGQEATTLKAALAAAGPAKPCDRPHTRFATMRAPTGSDALVELDGCLRFLRPDNTFGQLDEKVVAMLTR
jgi:hypothetical protein